MGWLKRNRRIRGKRIAFFLTAIVAVIAYGRLFFSSGVEVDGAFLERQAPSQDAQTTVYKEFPLGVTATVTGEKTDSARIVFRLPDGEKSSYAIHTSREGDLVSASILTENDKEICRGVLKENGVWDSHTETEEGKADIYGDNPGSLVAMAAGEMQIRGRWDYFLAGLVLFTVFGLDRKFSAFYYLLANGITYRRPRPLEFYMLLQSAVHIFVCMAGFFMLILAVY